MKFIFAACFVCLTAVLDAAPSLETQLTGTWTAPTDVTIQHQGDGSVRTMTSKQTVEMTFGPDHKYIWRMRGNASAVTGTWRVEGGNLITEIETQSRGANVPQRTREKIVRLTSRELVLSDGRAEGRWSRAR